MEHFIFILGHFLTILSAVFSGVSACISPIENKFQAWCNAASLLFECTSSFWFTNYRGPIDFEFYWALMGAFLSALTVLLNYSVNSIHYNRHVVFRSHAVVQIAAFLPLFWDNDKLHIVFLLMPKILNLIAAFIPILGMVFIRNWKFDVLDCYSAFIVSAYTFCSLTTSSGYADRVLIYWAGWVRLFYGLYVLVLCIGPNVIWREIREGWIDLSTSTYFIHAFVYLFIILGVLLSAIRNDT